MSESFASDPNLSIKKDDGYLAVLILVSAGFLVLVVIVYLWRNKKLFSTIDNSWKQSSFSPPPERAAFISAKESLDPLNISDLDELKKLLMRRAIQTIPILLSLQNEGSSIERLYKRGMLTDDMHFKVKELKAFVDQEFQDVQFEADDLVEGWGQHIWPQAMQFHQMIQRQAESKNEEQKIAEEEKKKSEQQKKKEKEKAKKLLQQGKDTTSSSTGKLSTISSSSVATSNTTEPETVIPNLTPEEKKAQEAEKMAQLLLEEEELERRKSSVNNKKSSKKA